jgi:hypothetical protein
MWMDGIQQCYPFFYFHVSSFCVISLTTLIMWDCVNKCFCLHMHACCLLACLCVCEMCMCVKAHHGDSLQAGKSRWQVGYQVSLYGH